MRGDASVQFTGDIGLRAISQRRDDEDSLESSLLLSWFPYPGTAVWLGYSEVDDTATREAEERAIFGELIWLVRI